MKEGLSAIDTGLKELESFGYLARIRYRKKDTKEWVGSLWVYADIPYNFSLEEILSMVDERDWELYLPENLYMENPYMGFPNVENQRLKRLIYKKINPKEDYSSYVEEEKERIPHNNSSDGNITPSQFESFWKAYPRKIDKGKAKTRWEKICNKPAKERPTWKQIRLAIHEQKKTERWQDPKYIPHPTTWLNQQRWLDDPKEMYGFKDDKDKQNPTSSGTRSVSIPSKDKYAQALARRKQRVENNRQEA